MALKYIVIWGLVSIAAAVLAGVLAGVKNRDYSFWMSWSFVFPPMVLLLALMPKFEGRRPRRAPLDPDDRLEM